MHVPLAVTLKKIRPRNEDDNFPIQHLCNVEPG